MPDFSSPVMTVDEVADLLRVHKKTVYEAIKLGKLPGAVKVGSAIRIHGPTVLKWLETGSLPSSGRVRRYPGRA